ncbi:MAG: CDP-diacylglycerol--glycerol-3-phosphate 3-phosphatidyltransferase [Proteobacteria bacterium]|jgi:cardiolipin synthase|nr:CDP-diacylglycerol--glycerol-3-phosphate 3-phosphatidyltransferase [Alphaproteobacteria bacterium]NCC02644.1 CDP-diacylglycerol--glycerol-3-phosphate 3-phosphatidyltransferase [Pseudomonadota bacterium]
MFKSLANKLTLSRIFLIPLILFLLVLPFQWAAWAAWLLFTVAGVTDWLDGYLARRDNQVSKIGQFLDPIADKLLVSAVILLLVYNEKITGLTVFPALVILLREVAVSGLREFLADLRVSVPVSRLAKWKTTIQLFALGFLIVGTQNTPEWIHATFWGDVLLWIAAVLTMITGYDYWRGSQKHFED